MSRGALVVLGKQPQPGLVKTRMSPPLSLEQAAGLYAALLDDVLETTVRLCAPLGLTPILALHPPAACGQLAARVPGGLRVVAQRGAALPVTLPVADESHPHPGRRVGRSAHGGQPLGLEQGSLRRPITLFSAES